MRPILSTSVLLILGFFTQQVEGQNNRLKPGFEKNEYIEMLKVAGGHIDSLTIGAPQHYRRLYRSPIMGLDNRWELWQGDNGIGVISLRGTTLNAISWLENLYAAMVPAQGQLQLSEHESFTYQLARNPRAAVHAGWVIGMAYLAKDILPKLDSAIGKGCREFIVTGDSQGGALAYLMTSYLHYQKGERLPKDIQFKAYCIAAPKPGNLYYAYDYELLTQGGWGFNVVNSADWVPEFPLSIQTTDDFNPVNPFVGVPQLIRKQKFFRRLALTYAFGKLDRPTRKAQKQYQRFLGGYVGRIVGKNLPHYRSPAYYKSNHYVRTGQTVVLDADTRYFAQFPQDPKRIFQHHLLSAYFYLGNQVK